MVQLLNESNVVTKDYHFDAFGVESDADEEDANPFRYCGEYFDKETDNIYLRARYYNPKLGRFMNEDPIRDGFNFYTYANSNPVRFIDPSGLTQIFYEVLYNPQITQTVTDTVVNFAEFIGIASATSLIVDTIIYTEDLVRQIRRGEIAIGGEEHHKIAEKLKNGDDYRIIDGKIVFTGRKGNDGKTGANDGSGDKSKDGKSNAGSGEDDYDDTYDDYYDDAPTKERVGKQHGNTPRDNQKQNEQTDKIAKDLGLTKDQARQLHDYVSKQGYGYKEILDVAKELFGK